MSEQTDSQLEFDRQELEPDYKKVSQVVESLLFSVAEPLTPSKIHSIISEEFHIKVKDIKDILEQLKIHYNETERAFELIQIARGFQLKSRSEYSKWIKRILKINKEEKISKSALETLSIIAYKQPLTRAEVENIRGVSIDSVMKQLIEKGLVYASAKKDVPGKPWLYCTTKKFLVLFGLKNIDELPPLGEQINMN